VDLSTEQSDTAWGGLDPAELPVRNLPQLMALRTSDFQVVIKREVIDHIHRHGSTITDREVCGILVGDIYRDEAGAYLYIEAMIEGTHASESAAQVTFTAETWTDMQRIIDQQYPDQRVVGWYHTHPDFGIFLSEMDLFVHGNFFNLPWQVAIVFDPIRHEEGIFLWKDGGTVRGSFLLDQAVPAGVSETPNQIAKPIEPKEIKGSSVNPLPTPAQPGRWSWGWTLCMAGAVFVLSGVGFLAATPDNWHSVCDWIKNILSH